MIKALKSDDNLLYFLYFLIILSPPIAMISGLFMAPWIGIIMLLMVYLVGLDIRRVRGDLTVTERGLIIWALLTCIWSISPLDSVAGASRLILMMVLSNIILLKHNKLKIEEGYFKKGIMASFVASIMIFLIEKFTHGAIIGYLRSIFQPYKDHYFYLFWLDRGCAMLSVFSWVPIYITVRDRSFIKAAVIYLATLFVLLISDSDSSLLAFICGGIAFAFSYFNKGKLRKLLSIFTIGYIFLMPAFAKMQEPEYLAQHPVKLPISHVHRLFIWKFAMKESADTKFFGKGIDTSRAIEVSESDMVYYEGIKISPMPRHPHNNVIQVYLELGIIGLILFGAFIWKLLDVFSNVSSRDKNYGSAIYGMFITYFVIGMIAFNMWQSWWIFVLLYGQLTMSLARSNE
jgi:O-antigen ligase